MPDSFIQVAPDSTGSKLRTYSQTVNAQTVMAQVVVPKSERVRAGLYRVDSGQLSVTAAAGTTTSGICYLHNPVASTTAVALKMAQISYTASAATACPTAPVIALYRFTCTGTLSASALTPAKRVRTAIAGQAADGTAVAKVSTASTGLTLTAGESVRSWALPAILTAVGTYGGYDVWDPDEDDAELVLAAGEGLIFWQQTAGTTSDVRRLNISLAWEEFTAP